LVEFELEKQRFAAQLRAVVLNPQAATKFLACSPPSARAPAGVVRLPGDKSISHRYAILASLAEGASHIEDYSTGADCASALGCMAALGARTERSGNSVTIHGHGPDGLCAPTATLDNGNSGSTTRMLLRRPHVPNVSELGPQTG
jgi:5-enolpyruvylshikimate-3-phosphate synthase